MRVPARTILREWGRLGCTAFGGPPTHIALLRDLCVARRGWMDHRDFEDAIAACNLLPGPASTQLSIFCAWRVGGPLGAVLGGLGFVVPGLVVMLVLAAVFLASSPPEWVRGAGAGAGAAVAAVAVQAAAGAFARRRPRGGRPRRARMGGAEGRRAVVRRRLRDRPPDAGRRGRPLPLADRRPVQ